MPSSFMHSHHNLCYATVVNNYNQRDKLILEVKGLRKESQTSLKKIRDPREIQIL